MIVATVAADDAVHRARVLQPPTPRCVDLNVHGLTLHAGLRGAAPRVAVNAYELNAVNPERLHTILQKTCGCPKYCGPTLANSVGERRVLEVLQWWHLHLTASERCFLMQHMYDGGERDGGTISGVPTSRTTWSLCGRAICKTAFVAIVAMSSRTLYHMTQGICSHSLRTPNPRESAQAHLVNQFFLELYMSAAEPLPHEFKVVAGDGHQQDDEAEPWEIDDDWCPERSVPQVIQSFLGGDIGMPQRYLTHTNVTNLYWLFLASFPPTGDDDGSSSSEAGDNPAKLVEARVPSLSTFSRVWKSTWSKHLRFRKSSQHAECKTCFEARVRMSQARTTLLDKIDYARQWKEHLRNQYFDRAIYWHCRFASRRKLGVLTVIIDSMDKAKFAWPQFPWHRVDKRLEEVHRPRLVLTAAIAHGFATFFFICDEDVTHGASAFCDMITRIVDKVEEVCRRSGVRFPEHLVVQTDNTVAQAKNSEGNCFLAYLVSQHKFHTANMFHLIVGHTHEDIDQLFAVVLTLVLRRIKFQTKEELATKLLDSMRLRIERKGEELVVEILDHMRDFKSWMAPLKIELHNAFGNRADIECPHSFSYKMRRDLTFSEKAMMLPGSRHYQGEDCDVFCCVKTYMHDSRLQQPPLCVLPASRVRGSGVPASPTTMMPRVPPTAAKKKDLRDLAAILRGEVYNLHRGADALDALADGPPAVVFPPSPWLGSSTPDPMTRIIPSTNELFPHLPDSSWHLLVRFKRK